MESVLYLYFAEQICLHSPYTLTLTHFFQWSTPLWHTAWLREILIMAIIIPTQYKWIVQSLHINKKQGFESLHICCETSKNFAPCKKKTIPNLKPHGKKNTSRPLIPFLNLTPRALICCTSNLFRMFGKVKRIKHITLKWVVWWWCTMIKRWKNSPFNKSKILNLALRNWKKTRTSRADRHKWEWQMVAPFLTWPISYMGFFPGVKQPILVMGSYGPLQFLVGF